MSSARPKTMKILRSSLMGSLPREHFRERGRVRVGAIFEGGAETQRIFGE
jgi:hypothetical protein